MYLRFFSYWSYRNLLSFCSSCPVREPIIDYNYPVCVLAGTKYYRAYAGLFIKGWKDGCNRRFGQVNTSINRFNKPDDADIFKEQGITSIIL